MIGWTLWIIFCVAALLATFLFATAACSEDNRNNRDRDYRLLKFAILSIAVAILSLFSACLVVQPAI